jgi:hypothetical protein
MMSGGEGGRGGRVGQKVLSKPLADSFAVGRRQKTFCVRWYIQDFFLNLGTSIFFSSPPFLSQLVAKLFSSYM